MKFFAFTLPVAIMLIAGTVSYIMPERILNMSSCTLGSEEAKGKCDGKVLRIPAVS